MPTTGHLSAVAGVLGLLENRGGACNIQAPRCSRTTRASSVRGSSGHGRKPFFPCSFENLTSKGAIWYSAAQPR
eukprot:1174959-Amphidinium_carterae.1